MPPSNCRKLHRSNRSIRSNHFAPHMAPNICFELWNYFDASILQLIGQIPKTVLYYMKFIFHILRITARIHPSWHSSEPRVLVSQRTLLGCCCPRGFALVFPSTVVAYDPTNVGSCHLSNCRLITPMVHINI